MMDRTFDICEALSCLAHDWGLYALNTRLDQAGFKPAPSLRSDNLGEEAQRYYENGNEYLSRTACDTAYDPRPIPAGVLLDGLER